MINQVKESTAKMDREKVIKGVQDARRYLEDREWVDKSVGVHIDALNDALALLKEHDTQVQYRDDHIAEYEKEIKRLNKLLKEQEEGKPVTGQRYCRCGSCGAMLFEWHKYCSECGTKIDWSTS
jgi:hypothetical protein